MGSYHKPSVYRTGYTSGIYIVKYVLLSADNNPSVYLVPDCVADNLRKYCIEFRDKWLRESPLAKKYHIGGVVCYNETDFIDYLNKWIFPNKKSTLIETLSSSKIPENIKVVSGSIFDRLFLISSVIDSTCDFEPLSTFPIYCRIQTSSASVS
jgi:hypothetical protein